CGALARHDPHRSATRAIPPRPHWPRNPRHDPGGPAHSREDRARRLRCLPAPPGTARAWLAAAARACGMTPDEYCQQKAAASGSSFYYSFVFLPAERRRAITALYAFCREVDDVVDEGMEPEVAGAKLAWWRVEVANLFAGHPQHPVTRALEPHRDKFGLSAARLNEIID